MQNVARINKLYGTEGELVINLYNSFPDNFDTSKQPLFARIDSLMVPLFCDSFIRRGQSGALVRFADIDSERRALEFVGLELHLPEGDEDPDEEFYLNDLVGFKVIIEDLQGELTGFIDSEINPLFEVEIGERKVLIPAVEEFIASIDFDGGVIKFCPPEGILDL